MPIELLVPLGIFFGGVAISIFLTNIGLELLEKNNKK